MNHHQVQRNIVVLAACLLILSAHAAAAAPAMEFVDGLTFDFGNVQANSMVHHTFTFVNTGDEVLQILRMKAG